jgi:FkbM family methyltransferase
MDVQLVVVGAHNGSKLAATIEHAASQGPVILVEPVDWLFDQLLERFKRFKTITFINEAVIDKPGIEEVTFNAPLPNANSFNGAADQLGSLVMDHAEKSVKGLDIYFEKVTVPATTFTALFKDLSVKTINSLIMDTEGFDTTLLPTFPFYQFKPNEILFEFKHSDGNLQVGKKLASTLILLDQMGYTVQPVDHENFYAIKK